MFKYKQEVVEDTEQNEHDKRIKAENDNVKLEGILKESEDTLENRPAIRIN